MQPEAIAVVGLHGGQWFGRAAEAVIRSADVLVGHARQLAALPGDLAGEPVELWGDLDEVLGFAAAQRRQGRRACILAAGDPGFFGLVRLASARLGADALRVFPAPSAVSLAFARLGCNWDDARVVSAHGRPLHHAVEAVLSHPKVAVLVSRDQPPEALGRALVEKGCPPREVAVCSKLGEPDEAVHRLRDVAELAGGTYDPLSVVVLQVPDPSGLRDPGEAGVAWGAPEDRFAHRAGMVTKAEVRAVALGKLGLPPSGVVWDVGAASGSVAVECALLAPGLKVFAVEQRAEDVARLEQNVHAHGVTAAVSVVHGPAPGALAELPDPDRAFVGGGGLAVLEHVIERVRPGGTVVATYAAPGRAVAAAARLGNLVQVQVSRGAALGEGGDLRLAAENPVFVCWGSV